MTYVRGCVDILFIGTIFLPLKGNIYYYYYFILPYREIYLFIYMSIYLFISNKKEIQKYVCHSLQQIKISGDTRKDKTTPMLHP